MKTYKIYTRYGIEYVSYRTPLRLRLRRALRVEADGWMELPWRTLALLALLAGFLVALNRYQAARLHTMGRDLDRMEQTLTDISGGRATQ